MTLQLIYLLITIFGASGIFFYLWRRRKTRGSKPLAIVCVSSIVWMVGEAIAVYADGFTGQFAGEVVRFLGVVTLPVALFTFVSHYCGKTFTTKHIVLLSIVPAVSYIVMVTTLQHDLFFKELVVNTNGGAPEIEYGKYFWFVHTPYSYTLILASLGILLFEMNRVSERFRLQMTLLFVSICIPIVVNVINLSELVKGINLNPAGFIGFLTVSAIGIFRFQLFRSNPIAYETVFKTSHDGVIIANSDGTIIDTNPALARGLGRKRKQLVGENVNDVFKAWEPFALKYTDDVENLTEFEVNLDGEMKYFSVMKKFIKDADDEISAKIITIRNITAQKLQEQSLKTLAFFDPLTMLANRRKFEDEFKKAAKRAAKLNNKFAVLYFDINSFKTVNDTMGHKIGDELLKYVAARIASILRSPDIVARLGGDEFAAILHNTSETGVKIAVERILENTRTPFRIKEHTIVAELSIGAALYPEHGDQMPKLLSHADTAMYRAKSEGGGLAIFEALLDRPKMLNM